jgi:Acetoacetate decarboxylase (ADC)
MSIAEYPAPPWELHGRGGLSIWMVPAGLVRLPTGVKPVEIAGRWFLGAACLAYDQSGVLAYNELAVGVAVRGTDGWGVHITHIWVDHPVSLAGGRELWGIPKQLAVFEKSEKGLPRVRADGTIIASVDFRPRRALPLRWKVKSRVFQEKSGDLRVSRFRAESHLAWSRARWEFSGALAFLHGSRPLASLGLSRLRLDFGI